MLKQIKRLIKKRDAVDARNQGEALSFQQKKFKRAWR